MTQALRKAVERLLEIVESEFGLPGGAVASGVAADVQAAKAALEADDWQPIDTAPKGGGAEMVDDPNWIDPPEILLCWDDGRRAIGHWDWYYAEGGSGCTHGIAWTCPVSGEQLANYFGGRPKHWMPVPAPPEPRT